LDDDEFGEPGGVEVDEDGEEWVSYAYEYSMAVEGDTTPMTVESALRKLDISGL
jgi:hypothetical protein